MKRTPESLLPITSYLSYLPKIVKVVGPSGFVAAAPKIPLSKRRNASYTCSVRFSLFGPPLPSKVPEVTVPPPELSIDRLPVQLGAHTMIWGTGGGALDRERYVLWYSQATPRQPVWRLIFWMTLFFSFLSPSLGMLRFLFSVGFLA